MRKSLQQFIVPNSQVLVIAVFLSLLLAGIIYFHPLPNSFNPARLASNSQSALLLTIGTRVGQQVIRGESQWYRIPVSKGQFFRLLIEPSKTDVTGTLYAPDASMAGERACRRNVQTSFSAITTDAGEYFLKIDLPRNGITTGQFELLVEELRQTNSKDHDLLLAGRSFYDGEQLRAKGDLESQRKAIPKYEEAAWLWEQAGDNGKKAQAFGSLGEVLFALGDSKIALDHQQKALSIYRNMGDQQREGQTLNSITSIFLSRGEIEMARKHCDLALKIGKETGDLQIQSHAINNAGEVSSWSGNSHEALEYYEQALHLWCDLNDTSGQAQTLTYFGYCYSEMGEQLKALSYHERGLLLRRAVNDRRGEAQSLYALGRLHTRIGDSQKALDFFNQAMPIAELVGDRIEQANINNGIGYVYESLDKKEQALNLYHQARSLFESIDHIRGEATTLNEIGRCYYSMGNNRQALDTFGLLLKKAESSSNRRMMAYAERGLGMAHDSEGQKTKALAFYQKSLPFFQIGKNRRAEAALLNLIGRIYHARGQRQKSLSYYQRALQLNQAAGDRARESLTLYNIASVERDFGNLKHASTQIEAAVQIVESLRTKVASRDLRTSYFASIQQFYELDIDLLMHQQKHLANDESVIKAFEASERGRMRTLLELLGESRAKIRWEGDSGLIELEQKLQQEINAKASLKTRLLSTNAKSEEVDAAIKDIANLALQRDQVEAQIREKNPRYAALKLPQPLSAREIQQMLDGDTLLLEFSLGEKRSYVWVVTQADVKAYELPGRAKIEKAAREVYAILAPPETAEVQSDNERKAQFSKKADALSQLILKPVANELGNKRLVIVADGILQYIPFSVLPKPQTAKLNGQPARDSKTGIAANTVPLIYGHEIVNLPSASTLAVLRRETGGRKPAPKAVAVVADPVFETSDLRLLSINGRSSLAASNQAASDSLSQGRENLTRGGSFKRLYGTLEEAKAIEELTNPAERLIAKDFDADLKRAISAELSQYRIIHFATHGVLDGDNPNLSALVFSLFDKQGKPQNGYLYLHDIYNLNLPAELVVLSACDTALGKEFKGEGLVGLTRGFMYAGAPRVMASLWKVGDEPTAKLMREFYRYHLKDGLPPAAALRQAQIKLYQDADWNAPYYWGSFVLQGEWK